MKNRKLHTVTRTMGPVPEAEVVRSDGYMNAYSGLGTEYDRNEFTTFTLTDRDVKLSTTQLESLYFSDDLVARMCDLIPEEELRRGFTADLPGDEDNSAKLNQYHEKLGTSEIIMRARRWANVFGSSLVILGANDGVDLYGLREPLNEDRISTFSYMSVLYGNYIRPAYLSNPSANAMVAGYYSDPTQPKYGQVALWSVTSPFGGNLIDIHESRCLIFHATDCTPIRILSNAGIADSLIQRAYPVIKDINIAFKALSTIVSENGQGVWKIQDLASLLARDPNEFIRRMRISDMTKSVTRSIVVDTTEDFARQYGTLTGYADIFEILMARLSACVRIPQTILFGRSPAGMSATGESDYRSLYDRVRNRQETQLKPALKRISSLIAKSKDSGIGKIDCDDIDIIFPELDQASEAELADIEIKHANAANIYISAGVVTPEEVAEAAFGPDGYSKLITIDMDEHQALIDDEKKAKEEEALSKQMQAMSQPTYKVGVNTTKMQEPDSAAAE